MSDALPPIRQRDWRARAPLPPIPDVTRSNDAPEPRPVACGSRADATVCERCAAPMFRMHAVWRCPSCGFKTDCCGW